jgi:hypothetical protein
MSRVLSLLLSVLAAITLAVFGAGYATAPEYTDSLYVNLDYSPDMVWAELVNIEKSNIKKSDVTSVEVFDRYGRLLAWKENLKNGGYRIYRMNERIEGRKLVIELTESSYGLKGIWSFEIRPSLGATALVITEDSRLDNIWDRGKRYYFGRNHDLLVWIKYIKVGLVEQLITTP